MTEEERKLTSQKVEDILKDCMFNQDELENGNPKVPDDMVVVTGIMNNYGLHKGRLESHRDEIIEMLKELPDQFHKSKGGGWSFLNACTNRFEEQWTGFHQIMEALFVLGIGIGKVKWQMQELALTLPGGMPYVVIDVE